MRTTHTNRDLSRELSQDGRQLRLPAGTTAAELATAELAFFTPDGPSEFGTATLACTAGRKITVTLYVDGSYTLTPVEAGPGFVATAVAAVKSALGLGPGAVEGPSG